MAQHEVQGGNCVSRYVLVYICTLELLLLHLLDQPMADLLWCVLLLLEPGLGVGGALGGGAPPLRGCGGMGLRL